MHNSNLYNLVQLLQKNSKLAKTTQIYIIYISYDGMTDALGQSQVLPYLAGLSKMGHKITILSSEKKTNFLKSKSYIIQNLIDYDIHWAPVHYSNSFPVFSQLFNLFKLRQKALALCNAQNFQIVHCRSYIPSLIGLELKHRKGLKFIFDMRGFWADERVEGNIWKLNNPIYSYIYKYFKKKEFDFLNQSDRIVSLTENGKKEILSRTGIKIAPEKIVVIPCCTDMDLFNPETVHKPDLIRYYSELNIDSDNFILSYLGSIGTWYLLDEMLFFFKILLAKKNTAIFLFITNGSAEQIFKKAEKNGINRGFIRVIKAYRKEIPSILSLSDFSIFFIKPCFSKKASSPTKMGELMSLGIPMVTNSGVGDVEQIINETKTGIIINSFNNTEYESAVSKMDSFRGLDKAFYRSAARKYYALEGGIEKYNTIYNEIII